MNAALTNDLVDLTPRFGPGARGLLGRCVEALRRAVPAEEVWLFGSTARGTPGPDSDLDLLVVLPDNHGLARPTLACFKAIRSLHSGVPIDVVAITRSRWLRDTTDPFGLPGDVAREGIQLYTQRCEESAALV